MDCRGSNSSRRTLEAVARNVVAAIPTIVPAANPPSTPAAIAPPSPAFAGDQTAANGSAVATKRTLTVFRTAVSPENALLNANNYRQRVNEALWWESFEHLGKCVLVLKAPVVGELGPPTHRGLCARASPEGGHEDTPGARNKMRARRILVSQ